MDDKSSIQEVAQLVKKASISRMRTVEHYLCDTCDAEITLPEQGFVIEGNIYTADTSCLGGLVGNAFPDPDDNGFIKRDAIHRTVLCKRCMTKALGEKKTSNIRRSGVELYKPKSQAIRDFNDDPFAIEEIPF